MDNRPYNVRTKKNGVVRLREGGNGVGKDAPMGYINGRPFSMRALEVLGVEKKKDESN